MFFKIIRKLKLGNVLLRIIKPFLKTSSDGLADDCILKAREIVCSESGDSSICVRKNSWDGKTDLDIIIPCYNVCEYVSRCLDSVLEQEGEYNYRIIAVDDGSVDGTSVILDRYVNDSRVIIVHQENRGFSGARNAGLSLSGAKYIMFLDSDDFLPSGAIKALLDCAFKNNAAMVEGSYCTVNTKGKILSRVSHKAGRMDPRVQFYGFTCMKIFRQELWQGLCFPEGYWYEDSIMRQIIYPRAVKQGLECHGISDCVYCYTVNPNGISHTGKKSTKSADSLYVTLQLYNDRQVLGLEKDDVYFRYILNMIVITYRRTEFQTAAIKKLVFATWREFILSQFEGYECTDSRYDELLQGVREGNLRLYSLACQLI